MKLHFSLYLWVLIPENNTKCETNLFIKQVTSRDQDLPYHHTDLLVTARFHFILHLMETRTGICLH